MKFFLHRWQRWFVLAGLTLVLAGCSESKPPAGNVEPMLIQPRVAVGKVHAGMTVDQVITAIGEPKRRTQTALTYPEYGLAVMHDQQGRIVAVLGGDVMGPNGPFAAAFGGRTKEGVGMNSTSEEIIAAFGEPEARERTGPRIESIRYPRQGLSFTLERNRVYHVIVRLGEEAPSESITLDLAPPADKK